MTSVPTQNTNQFRPTPVIGMTDLQISKGGAIACQIASSVSGTVYAGSRVKLDGTSTQNGGFPLVVVALDNEDALGVIAFTAKQSGFVAYDIAEIMTNLGPVVYQVAAATIDSGAKVEMASGFVQTKSSGTTFGINLDYAIDGQFTRVAIISPLQA